MGYERNMTLRLGGAVLVTACTSHALAQPDPSGIDFVTVGAAGNAAYFGPDINDSIQGRGSVAYEYKIGRNEVTTAQWMEFYNAFYGRVGGINLPVKWGAVDRGSEQSPRFALRSIANADMLPVSGPTWRTSAMFVNWLCNDKRTDLDAVMTGAYDVSTFGYNENVFTDQLVHTPGARYWIPTLDEWIKAGYYDPNYGGQGVGGWWWASPDGSNTPLIHGPPGIGQSNSAFDLPNGGHYNIPLGAYFDVVSPWGTLDMAGATREFLETVIDNNGVLYRAVNGSFWSSYSYDVDAIFGWGTTFPSFPSVDYGVRVATVPNPMAFMPLVLLVLSKRGRRNAP